MRLLLTANFCTDGDFGFNNLEKLFGKGSSRKGAEIECHCCTASEEYHFVLIAKGDSSVCVQAAEELLGNLICNIRTSRYHIVQDLCELLAPAIEMMFERKEGEDLQYHNYLDGNYCGTNVQLGLFYDKEEKNDSAS